MNEDYKGINKNKIIVFEKWIIGLFIFFDVCNCLSCFYKKERKRKRKAFLKVFSLQFPGAISPLLNKYLTHSKCST